MSYTYDTEPTTSYRKDRQNGVYFWGDVSATWSEPDAFWGLSNAISGIYGQSRYGYAEYSSFGAWTYDSELSGSYTNDIKP